MKAHIEVKDKDERDAVERAMGDPVTRATVIVMGHLLALPTDRARRRAMEYVKDELAERAEAQP